MTDSTSPSKPAVDQPTQPQPKQDQSTESHGKTPCQTADDTTCKSDEGTCKPSVDVTCADNEETRDKSAYTCCAQSDGLELELQTSFHVWYQTDLSREHAEELLVKQPIGK